MKINENFKRLPENYLFNETARRKAEFLKREPKAEIIDLGIGDVRLPLGKTVVSAMKRAAAEEEHIKTFKGYPPTRGFPFLLKAISALYMSNGIPISEDEIFVSDGAKSDIVNFIGLFSSSKVLICEPAYSAYAEIAVLSGKTPVYIKGTEENGFLPLPDEKTGENLIIILCSPGNPTGETYSKEDLEKWVKFALATSSVIIFDAAYRDFITEEKPFSIFEISGAEKCAVEICSFSKGAGFTGIRCGWSVVPSALRCDGENVNAAFLRKLSAEKNGVSYISQRGAEAALLPKGREESMRNISEYLHNAAVLGRVFAEKKLKFYGGVNSPYLWLCLPEKTTSENFFSRLLYGAHIVGTPGAGFGPSGEGYFRLSSLALPRDINTAVFRLRVFL